jgi:hypothetical protein
LARGTSGLRRNERTTSTEERRVSRQMLRETLWRREKEILYEAADTGDQTQRRLRRQRGDQTTEGRRKLETAHVHTRMVSERSELGQRRTRGTFQFRDIQGETHQIDIEVWKVLKNCEGVKSRRVDIDDLSQITPLH